MGSNLDMNIESAHVCLKSSVMSSLFVKTEDQTGDF